MGGVHSSIGPSALPRLLACPGSYALGKRAPAAAGATTSIHAAEGTVAHDLAEKLLLGDPSAADVGDVIHCEGHDIEVTEEMVEFVGTYVDYCGGLAMGAKLWGAETRVLLDPLFGEVPPPEPLFGTCDFWAVDPDRDTLWVADLKYGRLDVSPTSAQPRAYALGLLVSPPLGPSHGLSDTAKVSIAIIQPRGAAGGDPVKTIETTVGDLMAWGRDVLVPGVRKLTEPGAPFATGEHCRWCPGKVICPVLKDAALEAARKEFGGVPATGLSDEELARDLEAASRAEAWIGAVREEARARIERGTVVPGWKLAPGRAVRKWADRKAVEQIAQAEGPGLLRRQLVTPAQAEEAAPELYADLVARGLVDDTPGTTKLMPDGGGPAPRATPTAREEFSPAS